MIPSLLITIREVIEASLIVVTIFGILVRLNQRQYVRYLWLGTLCAIVAGLVLLVLGSVLGYSLQILYAGRIEEMTEGVFMITSAIFITWAVFFLHNYFARYKVLLIHKINQATRESDKTAIFILAFTSVFREGFEIVLFLSTVFFSSAPVDVLLGFAWGTTIGLIVAAGFFTAAIRLPIFYAFRTTSLLLILFAAGLLARGVHAFAEIGLVPETAQITLHFLPQNSTFSALLIKSLFGITHSMDMLQLSLYTCYSLTMFWWVFLRNKNGDKKSFVKLKNV